MKKIIFILFISYRLLFSQTAEDYFEAGKKSFNEGKYTEASTYFEKAAQLNPNNLDYYYFWAFAKESFSDYYSALYILNEALKLEPQDWLCLSERGIVKYKLKDYEGAVEDLNNGLALIPADHDYDNTWFLIDSYLAEAKDALSEKQHPSDQQNYQTENVTYTADDYFRSGYDKYNKNDYEGAIQDYTKSIELNPNQASAFYNRGLVRYCLQNYYDAITDFNHALWINPEHINAYYSIGLCNYALKEYDKAIKDFDNALELNSDYADVYYYRGLAKYYNSDTNGACFDWNKAVELSNKDAAEYISKYCTNKF